MRTAVGQARLLMKERFNQFGGLVDDCEFARGEKVTTCTDLQGFWDMVYFQVSWDGPCVCVTGGGRRLRPRIHCVAALSTGGGRQQEV